MSALRPAPRELRPRVLDRILRLIQSMGPLSTKENIGGSFKRDIDIGIDIDVDMDIVQMKGCIGLP